MTGTECPTAQTLQEFLLGRLEPPTLDHCENHVADCPSCHETLRGLNDSEDTLGGHVQSAFAHKSDSQLDSATADRLIKQLSELSISNACPADNESDAGQPELEMLADRAAEVLRCLQPETDSLGRLGDYRLVRLVGAGSSGVVFQAVDEKLNRDVAIKILRPSLGPVARQRFLVEAQAAASIDHSNVVSIYQVGEHDRLAYMAMQWSPGETLERKLERQPMLDPEEVRWIAAEIAAGLNAAHQLQMIHRDIKPANIWLCEHERALRILDFGLARVTDDDPGLTATGMLAGTPNYMSPEQARGMELDGRSDLFSLGGLMYRMLTGRLPFGAPTVLGTLQAVQHHQPIPVQAMRPEIEDELSDITMALLEKQPADRIASAALVGEMLNQPREDWSQPVAHYDSTELANASTEAVARRAVPSKPEHQSALAARSGSRSWLWTWITVALLALAAGGFVFRQQIIRILTDQGELVVRTDDPNVKVEILKDGQQVMIIDEVTGQGIDIESGKYQLRASSKQDSSEKVEFIVEPAILTMTRGGKQVVQVERIDKPNSNAVQQEVDPQDYRLAANDVLGIFVEGVVGSPGEMPPVNIPRPGGNTLPSTGYAVPVRGDGTLSLPLVEPVAVKGMTVAEAEQQLKEIYQRGSAPILKPGARISVTLMQTSAQRHSSPGAYYPADGSVSQAKPGTAGGLGLGGMAGGGSGAGSAGPKVGGGSGMSGGGPGGGGGSFGGGMLGPGGGAGINPSTVHKGGGKFGGDSRSGTVPKGGGKFGGDSRGGTVPKGGGKFGGDSKAGFASSSNRAGDTPADSVRADSSARSSYLIVERQLEQSLIVLKREIVTSSRRYGADHPKMQDLLSQQRQLEAQLEGLRQQMQQPVYNGKAFSEWLWIAKTDRHPATFAEALSACAELAESETEKQQLLEIIETAAKRYGASRDGREVVDSALTALSILPSQEVIEFVVKQLEAGDQAVIQFIAKINPALWTSANGKADIENEFAQATTKQAEFLLSWTIRPSDVENWEDQGAALFARWQIRDLVISSLTKAVGESENPATEYPNVAEVVARLSEQIETLHVAHQVALLPLFAAMDVNDSALLAAVEREIRNDSYSSSVREEWLQSYVLLKPKYPNGIFDRRGELASWSDDRRLKFVTGILNSQDWSSEIYDVQQLKPVSRAIHDLLEFVYIIAPIASENALKQAQQVLVEISESKRFRPFTRVELKGRFGGLDQKLKTLIKICGGETDVEFESICQRGRSGFNGDGGIFDRQSDSPGRDGSD